MSCINLHVQVVMLVQYIGETSRHLSVRVRKHLERDRTSHVVHHLTQSEECLRYCSETCFSVLDDGTQSLSVIINRNWSYPLGKS